MHSPTNPPVKGARHHPLLILAALAVALFCLVGTAAILGWLPSSIGSNAATRQLSEADRVALASNMQAGTAQPLAQAAQVPALVPAPAGQAHPLAAPYPAQPLASQYVAQAPAPAYPAQPAPAPAIAPAPPLIDEAAPAPEPRQPASARHASNWCSNCGNIESIRTITTRARGSGLGAGAGAVLGGLLGHQIGGGNGRQLATVAGAVGGAVVGNQVEGNMKASTSYEIRVRLDDGAVRTFHQHAAPAWRTGERVRIVKGHLRAA
jgi:outer membrane lipoprotein SlyB